MDPARFLSKGSTHAEAEPRRAKFFPRLPPPAGARNSNRCLDCAAAAGSIAADCRRRGRVCSRPARRRPLRSVLAAAAFATAQALGTAQTMAGATQLVASSGSASGITLPANSPVQVGFSVTGTAAPPQSWTVSGALPPGLNFSGLTSPGTVDTDSTGGALILGGTPTLAGTYDIILEAWEGPDGTEVNSPLYGYQVFVAPSSGGAPSFTTQPQDQTGIVGQSVTFTAAASGSPAYQWQFNGANIPGATSPALTLTDLRPSTAGIYSVLATNSNGTATSNNVSLVVENAANGPVFTIQPSSQTIASGATVVFTRPGWRHACPDLPVVLPSRHPRRRNRHPRRDPADPGPSGSHRWQCRLLCLRRDQFRRHHHEQSGRSHGRRSQPQPGLFWTAD